jgi:hypothetical protein
VQKWTRRAQACVNRFVVIAPCPAPPPSAAGCGVSRKPPRICCQGQSPSQF